MTPLCKALRSLRLVSHVAVVVGCIAVMVGIWRTAPKPAVMGVMSLAMAGFNRSWIRELER